MDPSYLKDLLWRGREVEFDYGTSSYSVKLVDLHSTTEFIFCKKWSNSTLTSDYFEGILYNRGFGVTLDDILKEVSGSSIRVY